MTDLRIDRLIRGSPSISYLNFPVPDDCFAAFLREDHCLDSLEKIINLYRSNGYPVTSAFHSKGQWNTGEITEAEQILDLFNDNGPYLYFISFGEDVLIYFDAAEGSFVITFRNTELEGIRSALEDLVSHRHQLNEMLEMGSKFSGEFKVRIDQLLAHIPPG